MSPEPPSQGHLLPLRAALEHLRESFMITDAEVELPGPRVLYVNPAFTRMTGYSQEDFRTSTPRILQGPDSDRRVLDRLRHSLEEKTSFEGRAINYRKDGSPFLMEWYVEPIRAPDGTVSHFLGMQRDVTEEVEHGRLRRSLERAVDQISAAVLLYDAEGRVRYANDAYAEWAGRPAESFIGRSAWELPGAPDTEDRESARRMLSGGHSWRREYRVGRAEDPDDARFVFVTATPVREADGHLAGYVSVGRDVTERRRLESIAATHNLHDNLGAVFSGIRHELGNPVNSLKAALKVVRDGLSSRSEEDLRDYLERMATEVGRVEYLLSSLRSYNLYDRPEPEEIDLPAFLARFEDLVRPDLAGDGVTLTLRIEPEVDRAWADPRALHQVLLNLVGNARAALEGRRDPRITVIASRRDRHQVSLVVLDNGPGISDEHLPLAFKPFFTTRPGGSGLGLPICHHLLSQMRSTLHLRSSSEGTLARILLETPPNPLVDRSGNPEE